MPVLPTTEDVRQAREQAEAGVNATFDVVKNPLFAALGAADVATKVVTEVFARARSEATERAEEAQIRLQKTLNDLQTRVFELPKEATELRHRLEPVELRKLAEQYRDAAHHVYTSLIERGAEVFGELRSRPGVQQALETVESGVDTAQERLEIAVRDLNAAVDELRVRFARTTRSVGERAALQTEQVATAAAQQVEEAGVQVAETAAATGQQVKDAGRQAKDAAEQVAEAAVEAGDEAAATSRSAARRVAERAAPPPRKTPTRRPGDNSSRKS
ncbi:MAG TPA: hypothetical protein VFQ77_05215 [Pseudonocardiaceae bacterium]|jgi:heparin binding hemagglutinin HbhA|nr:hypothetical protein [Pseudonocardiaceae bacterium]